ncbi:hypothetical protein [Brevundimonas sp.]|uniref:hypothetical protein n=1 Tax=Brevundimonas sp. TaxID=1871086 RepID=UPI002D5EC811|nr:hypothetical protein [Brevundimonas sp.]HYC73271.1 hypothetical protein [Brevundimonas sp.]
MLMTQSDKADAAAADAHPRIDPTTVIGWGVDADPENDPTWPMRDRSMDDGPGMNWVRPPLQSPDVEILQSVEHKRLPASIGTSTPPRGLSGALRRQAFRFSESQWGHWLLLMLADRINTVEGLAQDVRRGRMPNPLVEMGVVPQSRSREAAAGTAALFALGVVAGLLFLRRRR